MKQNQVKKNIVLLAIVQITNYAFPLITFPYLSRVLGPHGFGEIALAQSVIIYMTSFVDFGFNLTSTRKISIYNQENNQQKINEVYTDTIFSKSLLLLISALASLILVLSVKPLNNVSSLIIVGYISVIGSVLFPIWLFQGLQIMKGVVITTTTAKIISICSIFVLVHDQHDTFYAMFATSLGVGISGIISLWYVRKLGKVCFEKMDVSRAYKLTKEAYPIFLSFIGSSVYTTLNSFILSFFVPVAAIGIYSGADRIRSVSQSLLVPMQQAIYPHLAGELKNKDSYIKGMYKYGTIFFVVSLCISLFLAFLSPQIIHVLLGNKFDQSFRILLLLAPLPTIVSLAIVFGQWGLVNIGSGHVLSRIYLLSAFVHLLHVFIMCYFWGIYGAAISVMFTETLVTALIIIGFFREYKKWKLK